MFEKVNPKHPDKIADRIAGALVDLAYDKKENPHIAVEVLIGHGKCHIINETDTPLDEQDVLNSVDSMEAERSVILTCKALTKIGGVIFMSGRRMEAQEQRERLQKTSEGDVGCYINFFDENGFTALYRGGEWFYQKFHDAEGRRRVLDMLGKGEVIEIRGRNQNFCIMATKEQEHYKAQTINALRFEFNMILPNGKRYGLQEEITKAYESRLPDN